MCCMKIKYEFGKIHVEDFNGINGGHNEKLY